MDEPGPGDNKETFVGSIKKMLTELSGKTSDVTEKEIITMVNEGHEQGVFEASEAQMINNIFTFGDKQAQDIMIHRKHIMALDGDTLLGDAFKYIIEKQRSRYPVYSKDIDHIIGFLYLKDAVRYRELLGDKALKEPIASIDGLLREAMFIPETRHIDDLLRDMRSQKLQMVIVIDEYGQCAGLVAMEDILEEIVGSILDEYDKEEHYIRKLPQDKYIIEGLTPLEEVERELSIQFGETEFDTLNGLLISRMDRIPESGDSFETIMEGYIFRVQSVKNHVVETVLAIKVKDNREQE